MKIEINPHCPELEQLRKDSPAQISWRLMRTRCNNPNCPAYPRYGGSGIKCCDKWAHFRGFYEDMGPRPPNTTLGRIDNKLGYFKENCRWETDSEQARNRKTNRLVSFGGKTLTAIIWSEALGLKLRTFLWRINHWTKPEAFGRPLRKVVYVRHH